MYQKILLAADGSSHSFKAAEAARELAAKTSGSQVTTIHVLQMTPELTGEIQKTVETGKYSLEEALAEKARPVFEETLAVLAQKDIQTATLLERGVAHEQICRVANGGDYDLVVIGSRGLGNWQEILLGSVSERVSHGVNIPILIVK